MIGFTFGSDIDWADAVRRLEMQVKTILKERQLWKPRRAFEEVMDLGSFDFISLTASNALNDERK